MGVEADGLFSPNLRTHYTSTDFTLRDVLRKDWKAGNHTLSVWVQLMRDPWWQMIVQIKVCTCAPATAGSICPPFLRSRSALSALCLKDASQPSLWRIASLHRLGHFSLSHDVCSRISIQFTLCTLFTFADCPQNSFPCLAENHGFNL